jgi:molybdopterin-synthase adenylyltransferase
MLGFMIHEKNSQRYLRQLIIPGWGDETQEKLAAATVLVAGAGGLGGPAALYLAAAGLGKIRIVDSDKVELSNLNRQILHDESSLGRDKTASASERLAGLNSSILIEPLCRRITDETIAELTEGVDVIVDCLDSFASRMVLNRQAVKSRIPLVHAGIAGTGGQLTVFAPAESGCLACLFPEKVADSEGPLPVLGATAGVLGSLEAMEAIKLVSGLGDPLVGRLLLFDGFSGDFREVHLEKNPRCPVCSDKAPEE